MLCGPAGEPRRRPEPAPAAAAAATSAVVSLIERIFAFSLSDGSRSVPLGAPHTQLNPRRRPRYRLRSGAARASERRLPSESWLSEAAPSTAIACPLIWAASAPARNATAAAISAGSTSRPVGSAPSARSRTSSGIASTCSVATRPGRIALTVIPCAAFSLASVRTIPSCPAFDAAYATCPGSPPSAATLEITTIRP